MDHAPSLANRRTLAPDMRAALGARHPVLLLTGALPNCRWNGLPTCMSWPKRLADLLKIFLKERILFYRLQPVLVFVVVALVGMLTAIASWYTIDQTNRLAFVNIAEDAVQRLGDRIENHMLLIKSVEAHFQAVGEVPSVMEFKVFVSQPAESRAVQRRAGIGLCPLRGNRNGIGPGNSAELARNYGLDRTSWPETAEPYRTPIVMLEPANEANMRALGFDMCSEPTRRAAILAALAEERLRASGTVELVQENAQNPQAGFLMYTPFFAENSGRCSA
jgi:CHASE1-domain containing sensor protein